MKRRTRYGYSMWSTGKAWAVHVWSPRSYSRLYGFASPKEAASAALDEIAGMKERQR